MNSTLAVVLIGFLATACDRTEAAARTSTAEAKSAARAEPAGAPAEMGGVRQALASYEAIRSALAKDETAGLASAADQLAESARAAAERLDGAAREQLTTAATAAQQLRAKSKGDIAEIRRAFGELSRPLVRLISANPELQDGRYLFECPMAEGYQKWVQTTETIDNPYMGKKMAECGTEHDWGAA